MDEAQREPRTRTQIHDASELERALGADEAVRIVLHRADELSEAAVAAIALAEAKGIDVRPLSQNQLTRLCQDDKAPELLAMVGPAVHRELRDAVADATVIWLLVDTAYPGNAGFVIRTAEVSGANGVIISAAFDHEGRRAVRRTAMRADRFMPVVYAPVEEALDAASEAGMRIVGIEDSGSQSPWEADLCPPTLFVVGGERNGIPAGVLARCDDVLRLPMGGFVPSYNLQAAMAMVVGERLRQLALSTDSQAAQI